MVRRTGLGWLCLVGLAAACGDGQAEPVALAATGGVTAASGGTPTPGPTGGAVTASGGVAAGTGGAALSGGQVAESGGATSSGGDTLESGGVPSSGGVEPATGGVAEGGQETPPTGVPAESSCLAGITDYGAPGPFDYDFITEGSIKMWVPSVPGGCKVPVLHLANGTTATCSNYRQVLEGFASHGFLTTCYESPQTGAGDQGIMALEAAFQKYPDLAANRIGSTGHSQGGQAAFVVLAKAEDRFGDGFTYAGLAMQPASGYGEQPVGASWQQVYATIDSPMFAFSGSADILVSQSWVSRGFSALDDGIEAYHWHAQGSAHIPTPQTETLEVGIPWWRWKLLGDPEACKAFKALEGAGSYDWTEVDSQNVPDCP